ncbi:MAG: hypothetical protein D6738_02150, partial [Acidobacteria bacterium]
MRRTLRVPWLVAAVLAALLAACTGGPAPVFEGRRAVGGGILLIEPAVRIGGAGVRLLADEARAELFRQLRQQLAGRGLDIAPLRPEGDDAAIADRLVRTVVAEKLRGRRLRAGASLHVDGLGELAARYGATVVAAAVLTRSGIAPDEGEFLPIPEGELVPLPDERSEYEVPDASPRGRPGVDLDFVLVDAVAGQVRLHRRV